MSDGDRLHEAVVGRTILEGPAGVVEPGEDLADAARRECAEEIGMRPGRLVPLLSHARAAAHMTRGGAFLPNRR